MRRDPLLAQEDLDGPGLDADIHVLAEVGTRLAWGTD
jgi:hypothetical protein